MSQSTKVATKVSVGTKVAVAVLLITGLGAIGYASGYVKLDTQRSSSNGNENVCKDACRKIFDDCKTAGGSNSECADKSADCLCDCDPWFTPVSVENTCVDYCEDQRKQCENSSTSNQGYNQCKTNEESCLTDCDPWCKDREVNDEQLPDLLVSSIGIDRSGILSIMMKNLGSEVTTTSGHTYIYIDGNLEWTYSWSTLNDQVFLKSNGQSLLQPQYLKDFSSVKACIDANDVVTESNELNNCKEEKRDDQIPPEDEPPEDEPPSDNPNGPMCQDTDNGFKPYDFGIATKDTVIGKDVCVLVSDTATIDGQLVVTGEILSEVPECDPNQDARCFLNEFMCKNNDVKHGYYKCESYCYQGACTQPPDNQNDIPDPVLDPPEVDTPSVVGQASTDVPGTSMSRNDLIRNY